MSGAGRGGCGRKNGKDRALPRREEQDPGKPFLGFFSKLSLFPTPFFLFFSGATSSGATTKPSSVPRVPAVLPPRFRPAELRRFAFFPIIIIIINSNAGCNKKNQLFPPRRLQLPQGRVPLSMTFPWSNSTPTGQGALPRKRLGKTKIQGKNKNTCQGPVPAGEGSGSPRVKNPAGSPPPRMPKELQNHLKAKRPTARGRMGVFRDSGGKWDPGREGELGHCPTRPRGADLLQDKASKGPRHGRSNISPLSNEHILYFYIYNNNIESFLFFFL